jgi:transposase
MSVAFIGLDLAKSVFQVHGVDVQGKVVVTKRLRRDAVIFPRSRVSTLPAVT